MNTLVAAIMMLAVVAPGAATAQAKVEVNVNARDGETITGSRQFRVTVNSRNTITQVEFYVGTDLRQNDTSTPYEFAFDSLAENDGPIRFTFKAYTTEGESGEKSVRLVINNGLSEGAPFHIERAEGLLAEGKWDEAIIAGKVALRIDENSVPARIALARANLGKGVLDEAQKFAEDAIAADDKNIAAYNLLSTIHLRRATRSFVTEGGDRRAMSDSIAQSMRLGIEARKKAVDLAIEALPAPTSENAIQLADAAIQAKQYSRAIQILTPELRKAEANAAVASRQAYAMMRTGNHREALQVLQRMEQVNGSLSAFGYALKAVLAAELNDVTASDDAIRNALLQDRENSAVQSAQAFLAIKFTRTRFAEQTTQQLNYDMAESSAQRARNRPVYRQLADELTARTAQTTETNLYLSILSNRLDEFRQGSTYFQRAITAEPLNYDAFIEQGNRSIELMFRANATGADRDNALAVASGLFQAALTANDSSAEALAGLALVSVMQGKAADAVKWGTAATAAEPRQAFAHVALAAAYDTAARASRQESERARSQARQSNTPNAERITLEERASTSERQAADFARQSREALNAAFGLDSRIAGEEIVTARNAWRYYSAASRTALLPLAF